MNEPDWRVFEPLGFADELKTIWDRVKNKGVDVQSFTKGVEFAWYLGEGHKRIDAYIKAYAVDYETAKKNATNQFRAKWIQSVLNLLKVPEENRYMPLKVKTIEKLQQIIEKSDDPKMIIDASKTLLSYIKQEKTNQNEKKEDVIQQNEVKDAFVALLHEINNSANSGKLMDNSGELTNVTVIN